MASISPDRLGLLIQCRQQMDKLNKQQLDNYAYSVITLLPIQQLKKVLFVGFNSIKNDMEHNHIVQMRSSITEIIEAIEKAKKLKKKSRSKKESVSSIQDKQITIPIVPKNASLTKTIPFDIISNYICNFLTMSSITNLARCDRTLTIICHTPSSIKYLMHRHDPYRYNEFERDTFAQYMIDGHYKIKFNNHNTYRFKNVTTLSIELAFVDDLTLFNSLSNMKHLTIHGADDIGVGNEDCTEMNVSSSLETVSFCGISRVWILLSPIQKLNDVIHQLKSVSFIDCCLHPLTQVFTNDEHVLPYKDMIQMILPKQPNNLQILKFENTVIWKTEHRMCTEANDYFENMENIKSSLTNVMGIVYGAIAAGHSTDYNTEANLCFALTRNILSNLSVFSQLESIHTHSSNAQFIPMYLNINNANALRNISELCFSVSLNAATVQIFSMLQRNAMVPNLDKLCLVINGSYTSSELQHFKTIIKSIFKYQRKLKILQIVALLYDAEIADVNEDTFCADKLKCLTKFIAGFVEPFNDLRNYSHTNSQKQVKQHPLVFKFHIKLCHNSPDSPQCFKTFNSSYNDRQSVLIPFANSIQNMIMSYLVTYPIGNIQFKFSFNIANHYVISNALQRSINGLNEVFRISIKKGGNLLHKENEDIYCYGDMDFEQFAVSAVNRNIADKDVHHTKRWKVDCRYCCNTPWV